MRLLSSLASPTRKSPFAPCVHPHLRNKKLYAARRLRTIPSFSSSFLKVSAAAPRWVSWM